MADAVPKSAAQETADAESGLRTDGNGMQQQQQQQQQHSPSPDDLPLGLLPRELLLALVDAAPFPLLAYCQLIGLTHGIRMAIRGAPRVLSFQCPVPLDEPYLPNSQDEFCIAPCLQADALAAIVGPCKGLVRLTLPPHNRRHPSVLWLDLLGHEELTAWAEEAFGGHSQLAHLVIPGAGTFWPAIWWILSHLPGLEEFHFLNARPLRTRVLRALATFCPKLRVHFTQHSSVWDYEPDFTALTPLSGTLKELFIPDLYLLQGKLTSLVARLSSLERVEVKGGDMRFLRPCAQHLTHLTTSDQLCVLDLDRAGLCRLESLTSESGGIFFAPVMTACRDTLRSLSLFTREDIAPGQGLLAALGGLTHLTRLKLTLRHPGGTLSAVLAALPPGLLENQLEYLSLELSGDIDEGTTYQLRSRSLHELDLCYSLPGSCTLTLACPFLEKLALPLVNDSSLYALVMDCPHLRSLNNLQGQENLDHSTPMPELVEVFGYDDSLDPAWLSLLVAWSPSRLRLLSHMTVSQAMLSQLFAGCPSLTTLRSIDLHLTATTGPPVFVLRLPEQFEVLEGSVTVEGAQGSAELRVEAPGLQALHLNTNSQVQQLTLACPALVALVVSGPIPFALTEGTAPPLRSLRLECHSSVAPPPLETPSSTAASLLAVDQAWEPSAVRLCIILADPGGLARGGCRPGADLSHLTLKYGVELRSLVLDCPQLEELSVPFDSHLKRFELVGKGKGSEGGEGGQASRLFSGCIAGVADEADEADEADVKDVKDVKDVTGPPWKASLEKRFPNAYLTSGWLS
ncbi:hypothetical protein PAPYR_7073 [Paratrimastix pyriformis]|uniref:Uncharacterized protein n=1 Tax=Paratrimastix pyriformis TaxID=342808 RepID=A0ABQ8UGG9_9EUKA|nr:hypothetical protein PAPYR_7073 [Paratrimastix pyriformis]